VIDLATARETFETSVDGTVGVEEEYAILDPSSLLLVPEYVRLNAAGQQDPVLAESLSGELISSEIEIRSGRGEDLSHALSLQADARRRLLALARAEGLILGSTGTHPLSDYRDQTLIDTEHYRRVGEGLQYVAWRNNTFSVHLHVGVQGGDRAVAVCDRLRPILPTLLALSANSPYLDQRDSGLHSARTQMFTKSFPRCGVPEPFGDWATWADYVELLIRTGSIVEFTQLWWSIRPHHSFGTVEVRICDAQSTVRETEALSALIVGCVHAAMREVDAGLPVRNVPGRLIEENVWRAIRNGMDGKLLTIESDTIDEIPAGTAVERLAAWAGVAPDFPEHNGAQRQRRRIESGMSPYDVYAETVSQTNETPQEVT
jgi:carboxylate-amine ligase